MEVEDRLRSSFEKNGCEFTSGQWGIVEASQGAPSPSRYQQGEPVPAQSPAGAPMPDGSPQGIPVPKALVTTVSSEEAPVPARSPFRRKVRIPNNVCPLRKHLCPTHPKRMHSCPQPPQRKHQCPPHPLRKHLYAPRPKRKHSCMQDPLRKHQCPLPFHREHLYLPGPHSREKGFTAVSQIRAVSRSDGGPAPRHDHNAFLKGQPHQPYEGLIDTAIGTDPQQTRLHTGVTPIFNQM
ncbi:hypothetical protein PO909_019849 [Leuciscus waleckii]